jgi:hypothetical protein
MRGTLVHGGHHACAIGNMLHHKALSRLVEEMGVDLLLPALEGRADANPDIVFIVKTQLNADWFDALYRRKKESSRKSFVKGYSFNELRIINDAFCSFNVKNDRDGFFGLNAVLDALTAIHGATEKKVRNKRKTR